MTDGSTDGPTAGRTTIAAIAAEVGVSVPTVSKVLNGRADVSAATRSRVEEALVRHQYHRRVSRERVARDGATTSAAAGSVRPARLLELVIHQADSAWAQEIVRGVGAACRPERVGLVLSELGTGRTPPQEWIEDVMARRPLGVLLVLSGLDEVQRRQLTARGVPFVVVDTTGDVPAGVPTVGSNNWNGGLAATRHLLGLGHRRIAVVSGPADVLCSRARVDGWRSAHAEAGLAHDPGLVRWGNFESSGGYAHTRELLALPDRPTAIFAGSDYQALGVVRAAREAGLRVPEDLSVVGYDDLPLTGWLNPPMTTVRQPLAEMAGQAAQMLFALSRGETLPTPRLELMTELVVRSSTAPPQP